MGGLNSGYEAGVGCAWPCLPLRFCERFKACVTTLARLVPSF
jgi:hypothetical protein